MLGTSAPVLHDAPRLFNEVPLKVVVHQLVAKAKAQRLEHVEEARDVEVRQGVEDLHPSSMFTYLLMPYDVCYSLIT